ncbi:PrgI family protein [Candidatus Kaiserbacteria bacterium]|nr:MAG: PrgI family protein [Candidatus Kaiserbacteria bacterium]
MRFEVPQFIEVEDKIIGPLTWKQFVYLAGGVGIIVVLFLSVPFLIFILFALPLGALSFALAFHRVNNRPFSVFLESAVMFFTRSRLYLWRRETAQTIVVKKEKSEQTTSDSELHSVRTQSIHTLSRKLEHSLPE